MCAQIGVGATHALACAHRDVATATEKTKRVCNKVQRLPRPRRRLLRLLFKETLPYPRPSTTNAVQVNVRCRAAIGSPFGSYTKPCSTQTTAFAPSCVDRRAQTQTANTINKAELDLATQRLSLFGKSDSIASEPKSLCQALCLISSRKDQTPWSAR